VPGNPPIWKETRETRQKHGAGTRTARASFRWTVDVTGVTMIESNTNGKSRLSIGRTRRRVPTLPANVRRVEMARAWKSLVFVSVLMVLGGAVLMRRLL